MLSHCFRFFKIKINRAAKKYVKGFKRLCAKLTFRGRAREDSSQTITDEHRQISERLGAASPSMGVPPRDNSDSVSADGSAQPRPSKIGAFV